MGQTQLRLAFAELGAKIVLEQVGRSILRRKSRKYRGHKSGLDRVEMWQRHTVVPTEGLDLDLLLKGAFRILDSIDDKDPCLRAAIETYVRIIVAAERPYNRDELEKVVRAAGCLNHAA